MGETILITGASVGIGRETAYQFAREKNHLILTYHQQKKEGEKTMKECLALGSPRVELFFLDLMKDPDIQQIALKVKHVDWLINNAGVFINKEFRKNSYVEIESLLRTNLEGTIKMTHAFLPKVKKGIVNVASGAAKEAYERMIVYCASKFGLRGFTQGLALENPHLKIYCVNPGYTATRVTGYQGVHPREVGKIIVDTVKGNYPDKNGGDVDVEEILGE